MKTHWSIPIFCFALECSGLFYVFVIGVLEYPHLISRIHARSHWLSIAGNSEIKHVRYSWTPSIWHANVQSWFLIDSQYKPISLQYSWLSVEQPIRIDWVLYKRHWDFPINKKIIPMLTCPIPYIATYSDIRRRVFILDRTLTAPAHISVAATAVTSDITLTPLWPPLWPCIWDILYITVVGVIPRTSGWSNRSQTFNCNEKEQLDKK